jgi:hypothetical protein
MPLANQLDAAKATQTPPEPRRTQAKSVVLVSWRLGAVKGPLGTVAMLRKARSGHSTWIHR